MSLYISINTASAELRQSPIDNAITFVAAHAAIEKKQGQIPAGPSIDITFMLPGQLDKPNFEGMRMGGYTLESDTLFFETAVPEHILLSNEAPDYVALVMHEVVDHASEFFSENNIPFDEFQWRNVMDNLTRSHAENTTTH